jgi:archaellum component FlaF (FlaF/FlaG flagellin family)
MTMLKIIKSALRFAFLGVFVFTSTTVLAGGISTYHVTITNLTNSISFTPILVASHRKSVSIFELGSPASDDLIAIAEEGDTGPLTTTLNGDSNVIEVQSSTDLLLPGQSVTVIVSASHGAKMISIASMMLPTNDGFIALGGAEVSKRDSSVFYIPGYDAGSEANDELCINIPGPTCGGVGLSPGENEGDENYVHVHRGMHGIGDLAADVYDWRNPVAMIAVSKVK